jgi:hypothetical protein
LFSLNYALKALGFRFLRQQSRPNAPRLLAKRKLQGVEQRKTPFQLASVKSAANQD